MAHKKNIPRHYFTLLWHFILLTCVNYFQSFKSHVFFYVAMVERKYVVGHSQALFLSKVFNLHYSVFEFFIFYLTCLLHSLQIIYCFGTMALWPELGYEKIFVHFCYFSPKHIVFIFHLVKHLKED